VKKYHSIIIGGGLAGCFIGIELIQKGHKVLLINKESSNSSSNVAAGLFNPIMLKKFSKSWLAEILFPYLKNYYPNVEKYLNVRCFHEIGITKLFSSSFEQNNWMQASDNSKVEPFISLSPLELPPEIKQAHSHGYIPFAGWVDTAKFTQAFHQYLGNNYINASIDYKQITHTVENVSVQIDKHKYHAENIVFCEGIGVQQNPFFQDIKLTPTKGEVLTISSSLNLNTCIHKGGFIVPITKNTFKVGTTYDKSITKNTTTEGLTTLTEIATDLLDTVWENKKQLWGIRPNVYDRRPILGKHSKHPNMYIFNGLGSKGVSLGPYFANMLSKHILEGVQILPEVDYNRFALRAAKKLPTSN